MSPNPSPDPYRADAAAVYRHLRDVGPDSAPGLGRSCFPVDGAGPPSTQKVLLRRSVRRVYDAIVYLRMKGVVISAVPQVDDLTTFHLGHVEGTVSPLRTGVPTVTTVTVTDNLSRDRATLVAEDVDRGSISESMDVWHGG